MGMAGVGFAFALFYAFTSTGTLGNRVQNFAFAWGFLTLPIAVLLLMVAAWVETNRLLKSGLWLATAGLTLFSGLWTAIGIGFSAEAGAAPAGAGLLFFCVPPALVMLMPTIYYASRAWPDIRAAILRDQEARAIYLIEARGQVALRHLAVELGLNPEACSALVEHLLHAERLFGLYDAPREQIYSAATLKERQHTLQAVVHAQGQIRFDELAQELRAPRELVREWVYQLVRRGEFSGYINWDDGVLYSAEASQLAAAGRCPQCGGELSLAGRGIIQCARCGSEIFLSPEQKN